MKYFRNVMLLLTRDIYSFIYCDIYAQILIAREFEIKSSYVGETFAVASLDTVELCVPGVPFN